MLLAMMIRYLSGILSSTFLLFFFAWLEFHLGRAVTLLGNCVTEAHQQRIQGLLLR